jgi:hypothetical protein
MSNQNNCYTCIPSNKLDLSKYDIVAGPFSTRSGCGTCEDSNNCPPSSWNPAGCVNVILKFSSGGGWASFGTLMPRVINVVDSRGMVYRATFYNPTTTTTGSPTTTSDPSIPNVFWDISFNYGYGSFIGGYGSTMRIFTGTPPHDALNPPDWPGLLYRFIAPVRERREYNDWIYAENSTITSGETGFDNGNTISLLSTNSCRPSLPTTNCSSCINSPSILYTSLPSYPDYYEGCTGRPIDIDTDRCTGIYKPTQFSKTNFVLYFTPGPTSPFLIVDNIAYDGREATGLVKVFTTNTPEEMRKQVCARLRFASLLNSRKLKTNINEALSSNWLYNDLYWFSACTNLPNEVPINLIPC